MRKATFMFLVFFLSHTHLLGDSTDVFPLTVGNSFLYSFDISYGSWSFGYGEAGRDSGEVRCTITDVLFLDSATVWIVLEVWTGTHWTYTYPGSDTTYTFSYMIIPFLTEVTQGLHEVQSESKLWEFPVSFPTGASFPVFRYADSARVALAYQSGFCMCCVGSATDSLWFSADSGLVRRINDKCVDLDEVWWHSRGEFALLEKTIVSVGESATLASDIELDQNYPNPFNPTTTFSFTIPQSSLVTLTVFDLLGRELTTIVDEKLGPGKHDRRWDATGHPSGMYFYRLQVGEFVETKKLLFLK